MNDVNNMEIIGVDKKELQLIWLNN